MESGKEKTSNNQAAYFKRVILLDGLAFEVNLPEFFDSKKGAVVFFWVLLLAVGWCGAEDWHPPLKLPLKLNASFAEYRGGHFHGGLDFSTAQVSGHPVFAVRRGYLARVKRQENGEGNTVYLKHGDGTVSMYAHLEDFVPSIAKYLSSAQKDVEPTRQLYFDRGQQIAWSGESGSGFPHLHFEWKDQSNQPRQIPYTFFKIQDQMPPVIQKVLIRSPSSDRIVAALSANKITKVDIPAGIEIQAYDPIDSSKSMCSIAELILKIDGEISFHLRFDRLDFKRKTLPFQHYEHSRTNLGPTVYAYKLYQDFLGQSPHIVRQTKYGILPKGRHRLEIELRDDSGNQTVFASQIDVHQDEFTPHPYTGAKEMKSGVFSLSLKASQVPSFERISLAPSLTPTVPRAISAISLSPHSLYFLSPVLVKIRSEDQRDYLLRQNPVTSGYTSLDCETNKEALNCQIDRGGIYVLARDETPPVIQPGLSTIKGLRTSFERIRITDSESGVDSGSVQAKCQGKKIEGRFDKDRQGFLFQKNKCARIRISACDKRKNCTSADLNPKNHLGLALD